MIINITPLHSIKAFENAIPQDGHCCPVAKALMEAFNTEDVHVGVTFARIGTRNYNLSTTLSEEIYNFLSEPVSLEKPFTVGSYEITEQND